MVLLQSVTRMVFGLWFTTVSCAFLLNSPASFFTAAEPSPVVPDEPDPQAARPIVRIPTASDATSALPPRLPDNFGALSSMA